MNAPALRPPVPALHVPALRSMLEEQLSFAELSRLLEETDLSALALARDVLHRPLADLLARPGKEVRARLLAHGYALTRDERSAELPPALPQLVEMLHAGSLVIDDIQDAAMERRGAPALHVTHGLAAALNAGNWLYFWPLHQLSRLPLPSAMLAALHAEVAATMLRCHHGQGLDLGVPVHEIKPRDLPAAVLLSTRLKTGALLELSLRLGALVAGASPRTLDALGSFGREVGIALQMLDDLSSFISPARRPKALEDLAAARLTWPWAFLAEQGLEVTVRALQRDLATVPAEDFYETFRAHVDPKWKQVSRQRLDAALGNLRTLVGSGPRVDAIVRELRTLEQSYD